MKGLDWGILYNEYKNKIYDPYELEDQIMYLLQDDDVTRQKGIYERRQKSARYLRRYNFAILL